jgi:hypothetical protein
MRNTWFENFFLGLPLVFQAVCSATAILVLLVLVLYGYISWNRIYTARLQRKHSSLRNEAAGLIAELISSRLVDTRSDYEQLFASTERQLKKILVRNPGFRDSFVDQLYLCQKTFRGSSTDVVRRLYFALGLYSGAIRRLRKGKPRDVIAIMEEFMQMRVSTEISVLKPFLRHRREALRRVVRCYCYACLDHFPVDLLNDGNRLLPWEQIRLYHALTRTDLSKEPPFHRILHTQSHSTLVSLLAHIIVHFRQVDAIPALKYFFDTRDTSIRKEIIYAFGEMQMAEMEDYLVAQYPSQPHEVKVEILKALGKMESHRHADFLIREFKCSEAIEVKKHAAKSFIRKIPQHSQILYAQSTDHSSLEFTIASQVLSPFRNN